MDKFHFHNMRRNVYIVKTILALRTQLLHEVFTASRGVSNPCDSSAQQQSEILQWTVRQSLALGIPSLREVSCRAQKATQKDCKRLRAGNYGGKKANQEPSELATFLTLLQAEEKEMWWKSMTFLVVKEVYQLCFAL